MWNIFCDGWKQTDLTYSLVIVWHNMEAGDAEMNSRYNY